MPTRSQKLPRIQLNESGTHRCLTGHPWVFDNEFSKPEDIEPGAEVDVEDRRSRFIGRGYYNPASKIAVRLFTRSSRSHLDAEFFTQRLEQARARRLPFLPETEPRRLVFSEGDKLPGFVADAYNGTIVIEILTLGIEKRREALIEALIARHRPSGIYERSESSSREKEGLTKRSGIVYGKVPETIETATDGIRFAVPVVSGQKTGCYLDQRLNWRRFGELAQGAQVLDAFAYNGHFSLYAAAAGASAITALESSPGACARIAGNAELNGAEIEILEENAFDGLKRLESEGRTFNLISLDPPSFTRDARSATASERGYKEINLRAFRLLAPGGYLFTSSCSYHVSRDEFLATVAAAARDTKREVRLIEIRGASCDHPVRLECPETDYLKCLVLRAE